MFKTSIGVRGLSAIVFCLGAACNAGSVKPLDTGFTFSVMEYHAQADTAPVIRLSMQTTRIYGCCNYTISSGLVRSADTLTVHIYGIYVPQGCLTALGPAIGQQPLGVPEGTYTLAFAQGLQTDSYTLTITPESLELKTGRSSFTAPAYTVYWRYPANSFVYLCGTTTDTSWICDDFLATLSSQVELEEVYFPAYGEMCYPRASQGYWYNMPARYFTYKTEADFEKAGDILKSYSEAVVSHYSGVGISLTNWKDKFFYSWLLAGSGQSPAFLRK